MHRPDAVQAILAGEPSPLDADDQQRLDDLNNRRSFLLELQQAGDLAEGNITEALRLSARLPHLLPYRVRHPLKRRRDTPRFGDDSAPEPTGIQALLDAMRELLEHSAEERQVTFERMLEGLTATAMARRQEMAETQRADTIVQRASVRRRRWRQLRPAVAITDTADAIADGAFRPYFTDL